MPEPVLGLEVIFVEDIVVGHMTIVAAGPLPVRTVGPCCILGSHYVAVDTGLGLVTQI